MNASAQILIVSSSGTLVKRETTPNEHIKPLEPMFFTFRRSINVPLRPILSMIGSPQYDTSKWLCKLLEPVRKTYNKRCIKDSFAFVDLLKVKNIGSSGFRCSFDVVSLFTRFRSRRRSRFVLTHCAEMMMLILSTQLYLRIRFAIFCERSLRVSSSSSTKPCTD